MQNTMVGRVEGDEKLRVREKNEKGERKTKENYIKNGGKGVKMHLSSYKLQK